MPKTESELREQLSAIEPDDDTYRGIGPADIPTLRRLLNDPEPWLAARAVHALSRIETEEAWHAIAIAAQDPRVDVRIATAVVTKGLPATARAAILAELLEDQNTGVRKFAIKAVTPEIAATLVERLRQIARDDTDQHLRVLAEEKVAPLR